MGESRRRTGSRAVGLLQVPPKPVAALSVDGHRPHRGSGGAAPGRGERAVVDGVEAELVVELRDECDGVGVIARDDQSRPISGSPRPREPHQGRHGVPRRPRGNTAVELDVAELPGSGHTRPRGSTPWRGRCAWTPTTSLT